MGNMAVRKPPEWFRQVDERILEFLEEEIKASPVEMERSGFVSDSGSYINQRLGLLRKAGLITRPAPGQYKLTSKGEGYLAGHNDLRNEPEPE